MAVWGYWVAGFGLWAGFWVWIANLGVSGFWNFLGWRFGRFEIISFWRFEWFWGLEALGFGLALLGFGFALLDFKVLGLGFEILGWFGFEKPAWWRGKLGSSLVRRFG